MVNNQCPKCKSGTLKQDADGLSKFCILCGKRIYYPVPERFNFKRDKTLKVCLCGKEFKDKRAKVINSCKKCNHTPIIKAGKIDKYKKRTKEILKNILTSEEFASLEDLCQARKGVTSDL